MQRCGGQKWNYEWLRERNNLQMAARNEVIELFSGYSRMSEGPNPSTMEANCTCVVVRASNGENIIVDSMDCWSTDKLRQRLHDLGLSPDDFQWCVSTHGHVDHVGNNNLFLKAKHIVGTTISHRDVYFLDHDLNESPFRIAEDIEVVATRGHTLTCVSVIVRNASIRGEESSGRTVGIVGDLFEREEDVQFPLVWMGAGSEDPKAQRENRHKISELVDVIFPGHGPRFEVTADIRERLKGQVTFDDAK